MAHDQETLRATLDQIERLMADAGRGGAPYPEWLEQLALELRATLGTGDSERRETVERMRADPLASLEAQGRLDPAALDVLKR
jgi:hypothetical protein